MVVTKDSELRSWADSFISQCDTNKAAWDIPVDAVTASRTLCTAYTTALDTALAPATRSKAATSAKNEAKKALRHNLSVFITKYIDNNEAITPSIRDKLGLPVKDTSHSYSRPNNLPGVLRKGEGHPALEVHFKVMGSAGRGRVYGYNGAVIHSLKRYLD